MVIIGALLVPSCNIESDLRIEKNEKITMNKDGNYVELIFVESDEIWNHLFDNHYIASWGGFAPENEIKGVISPTIFLGLPDFWYVELRIPAIDLITFFLI